MSLYQILHVDPRASTEVINAAFKALALVHHPDRKGDPKLFNLISNAHDILKDSAKRRNYDREQGRDLVGKTIVGSYEVVKFLAEGAMGRTYIVRHLQTKKLACLKCCLGVGPEHEEIMLNEARAIWDIRHYAFPAVREVMKMDDGAMAIVMSYVPGPTLDQAVKHLGKIEPEHVGWIFERLLAGLNFLHANGVIHGDIKPQNVILQPNSHGAVMIDFGLAMIKPTSKDSNIGFTTYFSPPEQLAADRKPLIPETDLYSLGMTMLYALTGKCTPRSDLSTKSGSIGISKQFNDFIQNMTEIRVQDRPSWDKEDILKRMQDVRYGSFGTRNTRGKVFPDVPYDMVT